MPDESPQLIAPLATLGRADEIAVRLTEAIHLGLLADGEQLPPEAEFAAQLGVSPMTLRDAIATLRDNGLVETRRGRNGGTFVKRTGEPPIGPDRAKLRRLSVGLLRDIADEKSAISGTAARLAAMRATPRNVARLQDLVAQLAAASSRGARMKADSRFHIEVAVATRSERLLRREVALQAETAGLLWLPGISDSCFDDVLKEHAAIATAISSEDPDGARTAAEHHIQANLRRLTDAHLALIEKRSKS